jgi:2-oxoglutarate ferredoxin oxidoreductase subunit beta
MSEATIRLTAKDLASKEEVRWCPGCGDYAILKTVQKAIPALGIRRENLVFVSGIGCASRFPYYMNTYGFHTIHGRAPAVATGIKLANPELDVWVITGDGDALSIGGNHLIHTLRRNVDLQILLFNNGVYGLTKGQYSPTSVIGQRTPSTPDGVIDNPMAACALALGAGARFVARSFDTAGKHLEAVLARAHSHPGASFVEIFQNCNVYNDEAHASFTDRKNADDRQLRVEHGKPMLFGKEGEKGIRLDQKSLRLEVIEPGKDGTSIDDVLVHDETNPLIAQMLVNMDSAALPVALGVLHCNPGPTLVDEIYKQRERVRASRDGADLERLLKSGHTWRVG